MRTLRLVALSDDGTHLVLAVEGSDPTDDEHQVRAEIGRAHV